MSRREEMRRWVEDEKGRYVRGRIGEREVEGERRARRKRWGAEDAPT